MTNKHVVYLDHTHVSAPGWYWVERSGNRMIYTGPFKTEEGAKADMESSWESK